MVKESRRKNAKENKTWATKALREDHERIQGLFADFDDPAEAERRQEILDLAVAEIRVHRALVEEILVPAVRSAAEDPSALSEVMEDLQGWEALLHEVERLRLQDPGFSKAWRALRTELERHMQRGHQGLLELAETVPLNYADLGLRMAELRQQITAERPTASQDTNN